MSMRLFGKKTKAELFLKQVMAIDAESMDDLVNTKQGVLQLISEGNLKVSKYEVEKIFNEVANAKPIEVSHGEVLVMCANVILSSTLGLTGGWALWLAVTDLFRDHTPGGVFVAALESIGGGALFLLAFFIWEGLLVVKRGFEG